MAHAQYVKFLKVCRWGIPLFNNSITQEISMVTWSFWMNRISMFWTHLAIIQSKTSSGITLSAKYIGSGSLMNCISCSWDDLRTYCTGCSNTWKSEMSTIDLTIDSHWYHDIRASWSSLNHSIRWKEAPGRERISGAWSDHWLLIELQILTARRMTGRWRQKRPLINL